jgi:hypothetical protein
LKIFTYQKVDLSAALRLGFTGSFIICVACENVRRIPILEVPQSSKHTEKTNRSNDVSSINAKSQQEGVDDRVERSGESSTADERADTLRGIRLAGLGGIRALQREVGLLGEGGHHAGASEREDGEDRESHFEWSIWVGRLKKKDVLVAVMKKGLRLWMISRIRGIS